MDGILFYWVSWMYIIIVSFLLDGQYPRRYLANMGFVTIILSTMSSGNHLFEWNFAYLPFLVVCLGRMKQLTGYQITYGYVLSIIIAIWFVTIHRVTFLEPVWLYIQPEWMIIGVSVILIIIFARGIQLRLFSLLIGVFQGLILSKISTHLNVGTESWHLYGFTSMTVLEILAISLLCLAVWTWLENQAVSLKETVILSKPTVTR